MGKKSQPDRHGFGLARQLVDKQQVAERLRHLRSIQSHETDVHPRLDERCSRHGFALGGLALVVRKSEISAATVNIEGLAELSQRERRTFDVPTRTARSPSGIPRR